MNKLIKLGCIALAGTLLFSCETDPEKLEIVKPYPKSDQYYADLRDYRNSDHEIVFGWFGNWSATGASASNYMKSLPDSIDMVGLWGGWQTITEAQRKDMEDSQHKRGLKVIATSLFDGFEMGVAPDGATAATEPVDVPQEVEINTQAKKPTRGIQPAFRPKRVMPQISASIRPLWRRSWARMPAIR